MTLDDLSLILRKIGSFEGCFHLHGFGEPLLDRTFLNKVNMIKTAYPNTETIIFSTLGVKIENITALASSGLDQINVSLYGFSRESYLKVHGFDGFEKVKANLEALSQAIHRTQSNLKIYVKIPSPNLSSSLPIAYTPEAVTFCKWVENLGLNIGVWPKLHNYGNGRTFNQPEERRLCPVINGMRKNILNITWDLHVIPCCFDFNASIRFGSLKTQTLEEIFSSPEYLRFTAAHLSGELSDYPVCQNCEKNDY